jgi:hypothetical protein
MVERSVGNIQRLTTVDRLRDSGCAFQMYRSIFSSRRDGIDQRVFFRALSGTCMEAAAAAGISDAETS